MNEQELSDLSEMIFIDIIKKSLKIDELEPNPEPKQNIDKI